MKTTERSARPRTPTPGRAASGVTLVELMVTLAVLAILVSAAVPSFLNLVRDNRRTAILNQLVTDIQLARSAAIKSGTRHVICPVAASGKACTNGTVAGAWNGGWMVFRDDPGGTTPFQLGDDDGGDAAVVSRTGPVSANFPIRWGFGATLGGGASASNFGVLAFRPAGQALALNGRLGVCDPRGNAESRAVVLFTTGRAYISEDTSTSSKELCPDEEPGSG